MGDFEFADQNVDRQQLSKGHLTEKYIKYPKINSINAIRQRC